MAGTCYPRRPPVVSKIVTGKKFRLSPFNARNPSPPNVRYSTVSRDVRFPNFRVLRVVKKMNTQRDILSVAIDFRTVSLRLSTERN